MDTCMHCWYQILYTLHQIPWIRVFIIISRYLPCMHACMHACIAGTFSLYQITWIRGFVIISGRFCNVCMHACMHACMHCRYISLTPNTLIQCFLIIFRCVCNACMHALLIHSTHTKNPESGFCHYNLLCLQRIHSCIADTFNLHQIPWIMVFVIISCTVCNAWMHALLIHTPYTIYLEGWFLSIYPIVFAMHTCMHYWYIHFTLNTLNQGFCHYIPLCLQCVHACIAVTFNPHQITWIRVFVNIFHCVCNAYMHALLIHSLHSLHIHYTKYPDTGFLSLYPVVFAMHASMHAFAETLNSHQKNLNQGF